MNVLDLAGKTVKMRKASGTNGGEWHGPCPGCGGDDRFHVWPEQHEGRGGYWCRSCGKTGDNIQYLIDFEGKSFKDACTILGINLKDRQELPGSATAKAPHNQPRQSAPTPFEPQTHTPPADLWQEKAGNLIAWAENNLANNAEALSWLSERGIDHETAKNYRLGWNHGENGKDLYRARKSWGLPEEFSDGKPKVLCIPRGIVIPFIINGVIYRIRIRRPEAHRTEKWPTPYYVVPGSSNIPMLLERDRRAFVIIESELDAIAVAACNKLAGALALGSVSAKPDADSFAVIQGSVQILNALDYGDTGGGARAAQRANKWWTDHFPNCERWPVPKGKDPGDAVRMGIDLEQWIKAGLPPILTITESKSGKNEKMAVKYGQSAAKAQPASIAYPEGTPDAVRELHELLLRNPGVTIINNRERYTVLKDGRYVGGRISELVFRTPEVLDYVLENGASIINADNLIVGAAGR